jgi:two-component system, OmpR family, sensor kinase
MPGHRDSRFTPRRLLPRTLRSRLIAGLVVLLTAACATIGLVTYLAVQRELSSDLNSDLQTATGLAYSCWEREAIADGTQSPAGSAPGTSKPGTGNDDNASTAAWTGTAADDDAPSPKPVPSTGPSSVPSAPAASPTHSDPATMSGCQGLGEDTFIAAVSSSTWQCVLIGASEVKLTAADRQTLLGINPVPLLPPSKDAAAGSRPVPTTTRYLTWAKGTYELTAIRDPGTGAVYITGLSVSSLHDTLRDVALAEAVVFSAILVLLGVVGTFWVRFSLRPLRRVAFTAAQVADLPLESGEVSLPAGVPDTDPATETGQVGLAFNRMLGHVENALQRRAASESRLRRFAADASHELRTPLAAIRGYAELALLRPGDAPEEVTHALGRVLSESKRMSVLVDDLLLLARLDAGRPLSREPVDMTRLAIDATSDAQVARRGHRWVLELPDDPLLALGDEGRLRQVLGNLVSNAGRHTPDGTTVTVRVSDTLPADEPGTGTRSVGHGTLPHEPRLVVSVTDDGPGIPADLLPDLFERFTRADTSRSHAANVSSTGLGLAIVDAVVAAHQGAVLVTSRPGMTRFTIVLARLVEPAAPPAPGRSPRW